MGKLPCRCKKLKSSTKSPPATTLLSCSSSTGSRHASSLSRAVELANQLGLSFTLEEANEWITEQERLDANGELNDTQLESVAGGKSKGAKRRSSIIVPTMILSFFVPAAAVVTMGASGGAVIGAATKS